MSRKRKTDMSFFLNKLCLLLLLAAAFCLFFPVKAKAEIIRQSSGNNLTLTGVDEVILESDGAAGRLFNYDYNLDLKGTVMLPLEYTVNFTISFENLDETPDSIRLWGLNEEITFTKRLNTSFSGTAKHVNYSGREKVYLTMEYEDSVSELLPITYQFKLELQHKSQPVSMKFYSGYALDDLYPGQIASFSVDITDPNVMTIDPAKVKVTSSNTSVVKITKKSRDALLSDTMVDIQVKGLKAGSSKIKITYKDAVYNFTLKIKKPFAIVSTTSDTITKGNTVLLHNYIYARGNFKLTNIRSSNPSVVSVSGINLYARNTGTALIRFNLNGKASTVRIAVVKAPPKPTLKDLNVRYMDYHWYPASDECYYYVRFVNNSDKTITRATLTFSGYTRVKYNITRTITLNLKAGQVKTMKLYVRDMLLPPSNCKVTCSKFWYK